MTRRQYAGGAAATAITTPIASSGGGTVSITTTTGWPDGAVGKFHVVIDPGNSSEEKILCDLRSGTTISFSSGGRGADGTVSTSHSAGAQIWLCYTALDADEANAHINTATAAHAASAISFAPVGSIAATTVQAALAELDTDSDARLDTIETNVTAIQAINWVTQPRIADASVGTAELIDGSVTTAKMASPEVIVLISRAATQTIANGVTAPITFDTETTDVYNTVNLSAYAFGINSLAAAAAGLVVIEATALISAGGIGTQVEILSGGPAAVDARVYTSGPALNQFASAVTAVTRLGATAVCTVYVKNGTGVSQNYIVTLKITRLSL